MSAELIATPAGYRPQALVHPVGPGSVVYVSEGGVKIVDGSTKESIELAAPLQAEEFRLDDQWITWAVWRNKTEKPISSFLTTWEVPPEPKTSSGQLIYLFNGFLTITRRAILQPVLQWGKSGPTDTDDGPFWTIASWYLPPTGPTVRSHPRIKVKPGDVLVGEMILDRAKGTDFHYRCWFKGYPGTQISVVGSHELCVTTETLEAYRLQKCSDYPDTAFTAFHAIQIETVDVNPSLDWTVTDRITDCGQKTTIMSSSATNGEVRVYYGVQGG